MNIYDYNVKDINGQEISMSKYKGKVLLIVNVASKCGFTPQYEGLESLYKEYKNEDFEVLGFPSNDFLSQEPGSNEEIKSFCQLTYGVNFNMFSKINVNGKNTDPLFQHLKEAARGILGTTMIKWNFTKFLVDQNGKVLNRYSSSTKPREMKEDIEKLLK
ncbi:glutathione peroxidase [Arcobacter sp. HD9-500m-PIT-SAG03]|nr:glutathione peroxidase [Arcobacter sp. HD9-500m-PIT-SAG03]